MIRVFNKLVINHIPLSRLVNEIKKMTRGPHILPMNKSSEKKKHFPIDSEVMFVFG